MERLTQDLLNHASFKTVQFGKNQLRSLYLYWLSKPVRDLFYKLKSPEIPLQSADRILHWTMHQFDTAETEADKYIMSGTISYFLRNTNSDESVNAGLCRLMSLFLQPLQGTKAALADNGRRTEDNAKQHVASLLAATRVYDIMQRLHADNVYFPSLVPDAQSFQSILNLYGKRCKLLVFLGPVPHAEGVHSPRMRRGVRWSSPDTVQALGGFGSARDCVKAAQGVIETMIGDPGLPDPVLIHYSMLLSMMSYAAGLGTGMADRALAVVKQLEADPSFDREGCVSLYNPVLLAFVHEAAAFHKKNKWDRQLESQTKCEALWAHMQQLDDPSVATDPISRSIMMKLYLESDRPGVAQDLLETMEAATIDASNSAVCTSPAPTLMHYNAVLNAWAKSTDAQSGERAMSLLRRMEDQTTATGQPHNLVPWPDRFSYTSAMDALLREQNFENILERMEAVLERFEANVDVRRRPDAVTYNVLFHTLFRRLQGQTDLVAQIQVADMMEILLRRLKKHSPHFRTVAGSRVFRYYNDCFRAWAYTNAPESVNRATTLLREMDEDGIGSFPSARPNGTTYQFVLATISRSRDVAAVQASREIFEKMEKAGVPVTIAALNTFLGMLLRSHFAGSVEEGDAAFVESIMERFRASATRDDGFTPGWVFEGIFNHLNNEIDTLKRESTARRFELLFRALLAQPEHFRLKQEQNMTLYYNKCLKAWAFARTHESTAHALRILREMEETCSDKTAGSDIIASCQPNGKSYEYVLTCLSRDPDAISLHTARIIFQKMETNGIPVALSALNRFVRVLVKSNVDGSLQEAEQILLGVEVDFFAGRQLLCPNESTYAVLVDGYLRSPGGLRDASRIIDHMRALSERTGESNLLPSVDMYKSLIDLWSKSVAVDAMERVDDLFQAMSQQSSASTSDYAALQAAWGRSTRPDAPQRVESILVRMQEEYETGKNPSARPTVENFGHVIRSWALSKQEGSAALADSILQRLEDLCYSDRGAYRDVKPTVTCYENVLLGWTLSDSPQAGERALALLDRMRHAQSLSPDAATINQACYHHAILAVGKSEMYNKATKCYDIIQHMSSSYETGQNLYARPTHESFRSVIRVCAMCAAEEQEEALQVAVKAMGDYLRYAHPSARKDVYLQFLYSVYRLVPEGAIRDEAVRCIFTDDRYRCPALILNTPTIRDALIKTVSPAVFAEIANIAPAVRQTDRQDLLLKKLVKNRVDNSK